MLDAAQICVRFCCPECGSGLRAPRADAGSAIECHICGEQVRVPHNPHPIESVLDETPLIPPDEADGARGGCRLLTVALVLLVVEYTVLAAALVVWLSLDRDPSVLVTAGVIDLALVMLRAGVKWAGYRKCEPAAAAVQAAGWISVARHAAVVRALGYASMLAPWLVGVSPNESGTAGALAAAGQVAWMLGTVAEFAVLFTWFGMLSELYGPYVARRVTVYAATLAIAVLTVAASVCLATLLTAAARSRDRIAEPPGIVDLPPEGWYALGGVAALAALFATILGWQYYQILATTRAGLNRP